MVKSQELRLDLQNFLQFECENLIVKPEALINSTLNLLKNCPPSRKAVLRFYGKLFDELFQDFCNPTSVKANHGLLSRLFENKAEAVLDVHNRRLSSERKISTDSSKELQDETPQSPTSFPSNQDLNDNQRNMNISVTLESFVQKIGGALMEFGAENEVNNAVLIEWALSVVSNLGAKYSSECNDLTPIKSLSDSIKFWLQCPAISFLLKVIICQDATHPMASSVLSNPESILKKMIEYSPNSDWICAHLITSLPTSTVNVIFSQCIEILINSNATPSSKTAILSYLSEHNPRAIINSSKTNVSFLLKLCHTSRPLLNLMSIEAVKQINSTMLNEISLTLKEDVQEEVLYCLLNAPNAYNLLVILFDTCIDRDVNETVRNEAIRLLGTVVSKLHNIVYACSSKTTLPILETMSLKIDLLIEDCIARHNVQLRRLQIRIIQLLCVKFGTAFTTRALHQLFNCLPVDLSQFSQIPQPNPLVVSLTKPLRLAFGQNFQKCMRETLREPMRKLPNFWANLLAILDAEELIDMDLDTLTLKFIEYTESRNCYQSLYYVLRLIQCCMDKSRRLVTAPRHALCMALVNNYFNLLDSFSDVDDEVKLKMHLVSTSQKCMSILANGNNANQQILCRALVESELHRNDNRKKVIRHKDLNAEANLLEENMHFGFAYKSQKAPLISGKRSHDLTKRNLVDSNIRRQLLMDAVRCCVIDTPSFAAILVECVTPDVMFNNLTWPDEEFLKVTTERDLHVSRKFDHSPILWDFCDLVGKKNCLHRCSALIIALMAVQLTQWACATATKDKLEPTRKLTKLIAESEMIPTHPFKYLSDVIPSLTPWEIYCVLNDLWRYMKDNQSWLPPSSRTQPTPVRRYLERLRIILSQKTPSTYYVKIFKGLT